VSERTDERMERYRDLLPVDRIREWPVWVIGCGAGGRQSAILLASMGCENITLVDFDRVEEANLGTQGWWPDNLGDLKVEALWDLLVTISPYLKGQTRSVRFEREMAKEWDGRTGVFCCVDDMQARKVIWECARDKGAFFVDGRMGAEVGEVYTCVPGDHEWYGPTIFAPSEAFQGRCTAKSTLYMATALDSVMVCQWTKWLRGCSVDRKLVLNLLAGTMNRDLSVGQPPIPE
jgi:molybdopterin-synthase adenylyltransferase